MPTTKPLSNARRRALETAADRPSYFVLPLPPDVPARGAVRQRLLAGLLVAGLAEEVPAADAASAWRTDETGRGVALRLTTQGLAAGGRTPPIARRKTRARGATATTTSEVQVQGPPPPAEAEMPLSAPRRSELTTPTDAPPGTSPAGKLGRVLATLSSDAGATLPELVALTGWQPHTTRAALTRLRQRGYALERLELHGRKVYRIGASG